MSWGLGSGLSAGRRQHRRSADVGRMEQGVGQESDGQQRAEVQPVAAGAGRAGRSLPAGRGGKLAQKLDPVQRSQSDTWTALDALPPGSAR